MRILAGEPLFVMTRLGCLVESLLLLDSGPDIQVSSDTLLCLVEYL